MMRLKKKIITVMSGTLVMFFQGCGDQQERADATSSLPPPSAFSESLEQIDPEERLVKLDSPKHLREGEEGIDQENYSRKKVDKDWNDSIKTGSIETGNVKLYGIFPGKGSEAFESLKKVYLCTKSERCESFPLDLRIKSIKAHDSIHENMIAKGEIPLGKYSHIKIVSDQGDVSVSRFPELLVLTRDNRSGSVFIGLAEEGCSKNKCLKLSVSQAFWDSNSSDPLFYDPKKDLNKSLKYNSELFIPKRALSHPMMFMVRVDDTGGEYPTVEIYPYITLGKEIRLRLNRLKADSSINDFVYKESEGEAFDERVHSLGSGRIEIRMKKIVPVDSGYPVDIDLESSLNGFKTKEVQLGSCARVLSQKKDSIETEYKKKGLLFLRTCHRLSPRIFIGVFDWKRRDLKMNIAFFSRGEHISINGDRKTNGLILKSLEDFNNFIFSVNGFTWKGEEGNKEGQVGYPLGYVQGVDLSGRYQKVVTAGSNGTGGGSKSLCELTGLVCYPHSFRDGPKRVVGIDHYSKFPHWSTETQIIELWNYRTMVVSSSTSVIKDGVCSNDSLNDRWSAFGTSKDGKAVFISSAGWGRTNAIEMCQVFKSLAVENAIRLDGGPSASMAFGGKIVNKLPEYYKIKYRDGFRYIPYALGIGHG